MAYAITNYSFPGVAGAKPRITAVLDSAADVEALGGTEKWSPGSLAILAEAGFPTLLLSKSNGWVNGNTGGSGGGSGLPSGSSPNQYLVTDGDGNAKWEDKLCWSEEGKVALVEPFTEEYGTETPNRNRFPLTLEEGKNYTVKWDSVEYDCICFVDDFDRLVVGNASLMEAGANTNEPFLVGVQDGDSFVKAQTGGDHELSIFGIAETIHPVDKKYLPGQDWYYYSTPDCVLYKDVNLTDAVTIADMEDVLSCGKFREVYDGEVGGDIRFAGGAFFNPGKTKGFKVSSVSAHSDGTVNVLELKSSDYKAAGPT